ncbi:probable serine carboxypeptidase CPVL [Aplysia californica]|uniref:Probable serine carboxypeptidase CPVL n=1 Tax=Aplysia californica TaxID=6500 RepID=A0ABM1W3T1_APLCA|nr:probable serine carboxypeptidase CPVL [Aplysia californica]XP_035829303.1 probable serine carboxypeptidase CPVL [Aplysia californica]XP_035829324.1 probable serine carboxypeptidase CPVL [Aplysia californica]XP_035829340.1 probable serine carboxypeptidase CPVL [Aplysia californica]XP_035829360.1 probable serine carboxypeptidase CPVL [Aplysia californica]
MVLFSFGSAGNIIVLYYFYFLTSSTFAAEADQASGPLLLTPLLEKGDAEQARQLSQVQGNIIAKPTLSYSAFITVDKEADYHMHFWYFPSPSEQEAPLMLWLNGGPTVSSMMGVFWLHGPFKPEKVGLYDFGKIIPRNETWVGPFSAVYVDIIGRGFSSSHDFQQSNRYKQEVYTKDLYNFVQQFLLLFPEFRTRGVYIAGQSYAGHFVPALAYALHKGISEGDLDMVLKGVILGGPLYYPQVQDAALFDYLYNLGAISLAEKKAAHERVEQLHLEAANSNNELNITFAEVYDRVLKPGYDSMMDNYVSERLRPFNLVQTMVNSVREHLHVGDVPFHIFGPSQYDHFGPDYFVSTHKEMAELMDNYNVLIYNGDQDLIVSSASVEAAVLATPWKFQDEYQKANRSIWGFPCIEGFYTRLDRFCRVIVHRSGHQVPNDQPKSSRVMVEHFLKYGCLTEPFQEHSTHCFWPVPDETSRGASTLHYMHIALKCIVLSFYFVVSAFVL